MRQLMIHRYWQGDPPPADYAAALRAHNPGQRLVTWTPTMLAPWVRDLAARTAHLVAPERAANHAANVVRAAVLAVYGGWWADWDLEPRTGFDSLAFPATAAHSDGTRCSCWLAFPLGHPTPRAVLDAIANAAEGPPGSTMEVSGEHLWGALTPLGVPALEPLGWATHHHWGRASL